MKKIVVALLFLILLTFSCKKKEDNSVSLAIFPMNTGNSWTYIDTVFHYYSGYVTVDTFVHKMQYYYCVSGNCGFSSTQMENPVSTVALINSDNEGNAVEILMRNDSLISRSIRYKKTPVKGEKWIFKAGVYINNNYTQYDVVEMEMTCLNTDTFIHTPAGIFKCNVYSRSPDNNADTFIDYLSPGTGLIMSYHYEGENLFTRNTLIAYTLK
jgi:hypothetical protein